MPDDVQAAPVPRPASLAALLADAEALREPLLHLRRRIHRRPEIGLELRETQQTILDALAGLGLRLRAGKRLSSVVAVLEGSRPGPSIVLRADMDALPIEESTGAPFASEIPGAMHACGHDAHVAMLVGAARLLAARRSALHGRVVFAFQPGEEGHGGARLMLEEGLLEHDGEPVAALALHVSPTDPAGQVLTRPGPIMAGSDRFSVVVRGRGGHGSAPHDALDPVPIACEIVQAFQTYVTRQVSVFDPAVVTVARVQAGAAGNVIPETATLEGTIRTVSRDVRARVREGLGRLAEGIAAAHGAGAEVRLREGAPVLVNDAGLVDLVTDVAAGLLGAERVRRLEHPLMASEDFAHVADRVPAAMVFLGVRPPGLEDAAPIHSNRMIVDEAALGAGAALHAAVALRVLAGDRGGVPGAR